MPEEINSQSASYEPQSNTDPQAPSQTTAQQSEPSQTSTNRGGKEQTVSEEFTKDVRFAERWLMGIGALTLLMNGCIAWIYWGQLHEMRAATAAATQASQTAKDTLGEMKNGGGASDTHTLAVQASTQATQTTVLATAAGKQATQTEKLANNALLQAKAANVLAVQAQRSADYAQQSIQSSIDSDRPWIGLGQYDVRNFVEGKTATATFTFVNSGKRPASATIRAVFLPLKSLPYSPLLVGGQASVTFVLPGGTFTSFQDYEVPANAFSEWKKNRETFFIYGQIAYTDVAINTTHITNFCVYFSPLNKNQPFPYCTKFNEAK